MNEDEAILLFNTTNQYWHEFSDLVKNTLAKVPEHLRDELRTQLQEHSSCYSIQS